MDIFSHPPANRLSVTNPSALSPSSSLSMAPAATPSPPPPPVHNHSSPPPPPPPHGVPFEQATARAPVASEESDLLSGFLDFSEGPSTNDVAKIGEQGPDRTLSPASIQTMNTFQQAQTLFTDFDGIHHDSSLLSRGQSLSTLARNPSQLTRSGSKQGLAPAQRTERPTSFLNEETGQMMNYYPVPVPAVIRLPQKLSSRPSPAVAATRRSKVLSSVPQAAKQATPWLTPVSGSQQRSPDGSADQPGARIGNRKSRGSVLDPRLRASAFFDRSAEPAEIQLIDGSATKTFDRILAESATAPVDAFTDHPIAGPAGRGIYTRAVSDRNPRLVKSTTAPNMSMGDRSRPSMDSSNPPDLNTKRASSLSLLFSRKKFSFSSLKQAASEQGGKGDRNKGHFQPLAEDDEDEPHRGDQAVLGGVEDGSALSADEDDHTYSDGSWEPVEEPEVEDAAPTTLLAELQLRKKKQKSRNRTVLPELQDGMKSTLLELDAIAQSQREDRRIKRVDLAWEEKPPLPDEEEAEDDEDVPLELLRAKRQQAKAVEKNPFNPSGLLERKEREDNEPLAIRRARLRGEPVITGPPSYLGSRAPSRSDFNRFAKPQPPAAQPAAPRDILGEAEQEDETLAQRRARLRGEKEGTASRPVSRAFSNEVFRQFGLADDEPPPLPTMQSHQAADQEAESLAAIRERLKTEQQLTGEIPQGIQPGPGPRSSLRPAHSMADLLSAHPAHPPYRSQSRQVFAAAAPYHSPGTVTPFLSVTGPVYGAYDSQGLFRPAQAMPYGVAQMQYYLQTNQNQSALDQRLPAGGFPAAYPSGSQVMGKGPNYAGSTTYAALAQRGAGGKRSMTPRVVGGGDGGGQQMEFVDRWRSGIGADGTSRNGGNGGVQAFS